MRYTRNHKMGHVILPGKPVISSCMHDPHNPWFIYSQKYPNVLTGHYRMREAYRIRRLRGTQDWLLIYTLGGRGLFRHAQVSRVSRPGDLMLIGPATAHDYGIDPALGRWDLLWAHFHPLPTWLPLLDWPRVAPGLMSLHPTNQSIRQRILDYFKQVNHLASGAMARHEWLAVHALEGLLLWCDTINPRAAASGLDPRIQATMECIRRNLSEPLTLARLARVSHLSISRLSCLFRAQVGMTPQQYVEAQRLDRATRLLQIPSISIKQIAAEVGFNDPFYFSQRFHRRNGISPREYRRRCEGEARNESGLAPES